MIIPNENDADVSDLRPINAAILVAGDRVIGWLEDKTFRTL
jgi:hypothetical protein